MASARRIVEGDRYAHSAEFVRYDPGYMLGREVHGKTLGIIGMGRIGQQVARRAIGFDMTVLYHNRHRREDVERALAPSVQFAEKDDLLAQSDYVMLCVPLTDQTRGSIGTRELSLMKSDATLINIARGAVVDTRGTDEGDGAGPHRRRGPRRDRARATAPRPPPPGHAQRHHHPPPGQRDGRDPPPHGRALRREPPRWPPRRAAAASGHPMNHRSVRIGTFGLSRRRWEAGPFNIPSERSAGSVGDERRIRLATHSSAPRWSIQFLEADLALPPGLGIQHFRRSDVVQFHAGHNFHPETDAFHLGEKHAILSPLAKWGWGSARTQRNLEALNPA